MSLVKNIKNYLQQKSEKDMSIGKIIQTRYVDKEKHSQEFLLSFYENLDNKKIFKATIQSIIGDIDVKKHYITAFLENYTLSEKNRQDSMEDCIKSLNVVYGGKIKEIQLCDDFASVTIGNKTYSVQKMTNESNLNPKVKDELLSTSRYQKCHQRCVQIAAGYNGSGKGNPHVATGWYCDESSKKQFLHTWIEMEEKDKIYCADYVRNMVMEADSYYDLFNITKDDVKRIPFKTVKEDFPILKNVCNEYDSSIKFYLDDRETALSLYANEKEM